VTNVALDSAEIVCLTGYEQPCKQLAVLHKRGFVRAFMGRKGVVLERPHFEAVSRGYMGPAKTKEANLGIFGARK
jgi:hypothetical protein